ncbi:NADP-dependent oxidoreductase [Paeniglutamicibacter cryotolerans]|uniref:NADPH:quinone reductase-like Zn-dependent oxidoreductase n=1 Tax=Paeniglutamicibacter cryotolerans TaxID=670079 RepID=A0A839QFJ2_9MICC|nr:NADP-dependent oxidoreductase [Paeniglutamicibacter cryotolerans]MBB2994393.1 NADPH:quinone reductase-like Zn-dependent oxidoreductase [Paeniglutamicibacter cryotolerans]
MKAFVIPRQGAAVVERVDVPIPHPGEDELLVCIRAVGVGIHDSSFLPADAAYPFPIGIEASGVVEAVGDAVRGRRPGERIAFVSALQPKGGTWAQYCVLKADSLIIDVPEALDFHRAAALPVAGNTSLRALRALGPAPAGGTLFIAGGSGAIGTLAIQLAVRRGWRVAASASEANHAYLGSLGAEKVVDYRDGLWREQVIDWKPGGVDAVLAVQPGTSAQSLGVVMDGGTLISISGDGPEPERGIRLLVVPHLLDVADELARLFEQVDAGGIHLEIERVYPFDEALAALAKVRTRRAGGKVVLAL